jgi:hypothetical protein
MEQTSVTEITPGIPTEVVIGASLVVLVIAFAWTAFHGFRRRTTSSSSLDGRGGIAIAASFVVIGLVTAFDHGPFRSGAFDLIRISTPIVAAAVGLLVLTVKMPSTPESDSEPIRTADLKARDPLTFVSRSSVISTGIALILVLAGLLGIGVYGNKVGPVLYPVPGGVITYGPSGVVTFPLAVDWPTVSIVVACALALATCCWITLRRISAPKISTTDTQSDTAIRHGQSRLALVLTAAGLVGALGQVVLQSGQNLAASYTLQPDGAQVYLYGPMSGFTLVGPHALAGWTFVIAGDFILFGLIGAVLAALLTMVPASRRRHQRAALSSASV